MKAARLTAYIASNTVLNRIQFNYIVRELLNFFDYLMIGIKNSIS